MTRRNKLVSLCSVFMLVIGCLVLTPIGEGAAITTLFNTGVNNAGTPLPDGTIGDPHYSLISVPSGTTSIRVRREAGGWPIPPYIGDNSASAWIGPNNYPNLDSPPGNYTYRTACDLTGFDPSTAMISGNWSADNIGVDILLNGTSLGYTTPLGQFQYGFVPFTILTGFLPGVNTIDFVINEDPSASNDPDWTPTALRVEMTGTANVAVPEPSTCVTLAAGLLFGCWHTLRRKPDARVLALLFCCLISSTSLAVNYELVTVGDAGNAADTTGYGAVPYEYQIGKYEVTNQQYTDFLNAVAATDSYGLYNGLMGSDASGGITQSGTPGTYAYVVRPNMGTKPVNWVSWFDAARFANWMQNGQGSASTETGAYNLVSGQTSGTAPARSPISQFYIPTEDEWYKAAYYKGGGTNVGYWTYATQSDTAPIAVAADSVGNGLAGSTGNFANFSSAAVWNGQTGKLTTVGTNGEASVYGAFDMNGNAYEWNDLTGAAGSSRGIRGGRWTSDVLVLPSSLRRAISPSSENGLGSGFRLAAAVPEPTTSATLAAGLAIGWLALRRNA